MLKIISKMMETFLKHLNWLSIIIYAKNCSDWHKENLLNGHISCLYLRTKRGDSEMDLECGVCLKLMEYN